MSLLFVDGFDHYAVADLLKKWTTKEGSTSTLAIDVGRRNGGALSSGIGSSVGVTKTLPAAKNTLIVGVAYKLTAQNGTGANRGILQFRDSSTVHLTVRINVDLTLSVLKGTDIGTVLGVSSETLDVGSFNYIEFKATIDDVAGSFELRINGINVLSASGIDTRTTGGNASANVIMVGSNGSNGPSWVIDDFYICDNSGSSNNDFLGDVRIDTLLPNADGTFSQFVPSTGTSHFALVDETAPNTTDHVDGVNVGDRDSFNCQDLTALIAQTVFGVQVNAFAQKDDAGSKSISTFARNGTTNSDGASFGLSTSQVCLSQMFEKQPSGVDWTESAVNASEFGVRVTA